MRVEFFEKPGCGGNAKQRALLTGLGYALEVKDMLSEPWTPQALRPFLAARPVAEWFNMSARKVKSGEVDPSSFNEASALAVLAADPLLIRRPLLRTEKGCASGFSPDHLAAIGIEIAAADAPGEGCQAGGSHQCGGAHHS